MTKPIEDKILNEAQGAHRTSQEILALMQEEGDEDDPIRLIFAVLKDIAIHQRQMASDLKAVNEKLNGLLRQKDAPPG